MRPPGFRQEVCCADSTCLPRPTWRERRESSLTAGSCLAFGFHQLAPGSRADPHRPCGNLLNPYPATRIHSSGIWVVRPIPVGQFTNCSLPGPSRLVGYPASSLLFQVVTTECHFSEVFPHRFFRTFPPPPAPGGLTASTVFGASRQLLSGSSADSAGDLRFGEIAACLTGGEFQEIVAPETGGSLRGDARLGGEALHGAQGDLPCGLNPVEQAGSVSPGHRGHRRPRRAPRAPGPGAPRVQARPGPGGRPGRPAPRKVLREEGGPPRPEGAAQERRARALRLLRAGYPGA
jgi:hypothetical protein